MNTGDQHSLAPTAGAQPPPGSVDDGSQRPPGQQAQLPTTTVPTDLRVNTTALNAVALSSVAKYWVLTNLLPGPIPQVSVYGLPGARNDNTGKPTQLVDELQHILGKSGNASLSYYLSKDLIEVLMQGLGVPISMIVPPIRKQESEEIEDEIQKEVEE